MATSKQRERSLGIENLEDRRLLAASIGFANGTIFINGTNANDVAYVTESNNTVTVQGNVVGNSTFNASSVRQIYFYGYGGDDYFMNKTAIHSRSYGDAGNDTIIGGSGYDWMDGGAGNDAMWGDYSSSSGRGDVMYGGSGNDYLNAGGGDDLVFGGTGDDRMYGFGGKDVMYGEAGNDTLMGGDDADYLDGGAEDDHLDGAYYGVDDNARDTLVGGAGRDHFVDYQRFDGFSGFGIKYASNDELRDYSWSADTREVHRQELVFSSDPLILNL